MKMKVVKTLALGLVLTLTLVTSMLVIGCDDDDGRGPLTSTIDYEFVAHLQTIPDDLDEQGRLLIWEATISGDFTGTVKWWFDLSETHSVGNIACYAGRWEIFDSAGNLLLAGESAGRTVTPSGEDGIWQGSGRVTEASEEYEDLIGRHVYEAGNVTYQDFGPDADGNPIIKPKDGSGTFRIYCGSD